MSKSSFDITKFSKEKTIIYVNSYDDYARYLIPILVSQIYYSNEIYLSNNRVSIILDDFYNLKPIKNFSKILNYSRSNGIMFTIMVRGLNDLENVYTKKDLEILLNIDNLTLSFSFNNAITFWTSLLAYKDFSLNHVSNSTLKLLKSFCKLPSNTFVP